MASYSRKFNGQTFSLSTDACTYTHSFKTKKRKRKFIIVEKFFIAISLTCEELR